VLDDLAADLRVRNPDRVVDVQRVGATVVLADSDRIRQALTALVANAVKYSPEGSPIELIAEQRFGAVGVRVVDHGRGIPAAELPRVFDRFYRVAGAGPKGSGLGLAVVAAIVTAHAGRYGVESEPGKGSVFWIELDARPIDG
jgi:two-component system OmpR family sensor kinase